MIHILVLLYLLLWFWDFHIKNLQDFINISSALIKDARGVLVFEDTENFASFSATVLRGAVVVMDAGMNVLLSAADSEVGAATGATGLFYTTTKEDPRNAPMAAKKTA